MSSQNPGIRSGCRRFGRVLAVVVPVVAITLALESGIATTIREFTTRPVGSFGFEEDNLKRVQDAEDLFSAQETETGKKLAVVIGSSSMRAAVSITAFNEAHGNNWNVMGLCSIGPVISEISQHLDVLEQSILDPDHIVIGLMPRDFYFDVSRIPGSTGNETSSPTVTRPDADSLPVSRRLLDRLREDQTEVALRMESLLTSVRRSVYRTDGSASQLRFNYGRRDSSKSLEKTAGNPFREVIYGDIVTGDDEVDQAEHFASDDFRLTGYLQLTDTMMIENGAPLRGRLRKLLDRGTAVTVIFLPEHSLARATVSQELCESCRIYLEETADNHPGFRLVGMREVLPDTSFYDVLHVGRFGRRLSIPLLTPLVVPQHSVTR